MSRRYTSELYEDRVKYIKKLMPDACVGGDVIVGFPGEDKNEFDITLEFIGAPPLNVGIGSNLHGTSYDSSQAEEISIDEVVTDISNEGHRTTSVKATGYFTTA